MKHIFTALLFLSFTFGFGQDTTTPKEDAKVVKENSSDVVVHATPKVGMKAFKENIEKSFRLPDVTEKTSGTVIVKFVVWEDGSLRDFQIIKETPANLGLGNESIRLLTKSEKWLPGIHNGKIAKQYYTMPISVEIMPSKKVSKLIKKVSQPIQEVKKEEVPIVTEDNITSSEKQAEPIGGITKFYTDLSAKIQVPEVEVAGNYKTKVKFVVNQDGSLSDYQVLEETPSNVGLGQNVIKYLQSIENWIPSEKNGKKVKTYFVLPVTLNIEPESVIKKKD